MKCPTCHEEYATRAGYDAHVPNCAYKDNPLPEPKLALVVDLYKPLDRMNKAELLAFAELKRIEATEGMTKANIISLIQERQDLDELAEHLEIEGFETMNKDQLIAAIEEAEKGKDE